MPGRHASLGPPGRALPATARDLTSVSKLGAAAGLMAALALARGARATHNESSSSITIPTLAKREMHRRACTETPSPRVTAAPAPGSREGGRDAPSRTRPLGHQRPLAINEEIRGASAHSGAVLDNERLPLPQGASCPRMGTGQLTRPLPNGREPRASGAIGTAARRAVRRRRCHDVAVRHGADGSSGPRSSARAEVGWEAPTLRARKARGCDSTPARHPERQTLRGSSPQTLATTVNPTRVGSSKPRQCRIQSVEVPYPSKANS
ncbi:unnamed protein product [Lampetra planeri]